MGGAKRDRESQSVCFGQRKRERRRRRRRDPVWGIILFGRIHLRFLTFATRNLYCYTGEEERL